jgi:hypothetical protein
LMAPMLLTCTAVTPNPALVMCRTQPPQQPHVASLYTVTVRPDRAYSEAAGVCVATAWGDMGNRGAVCYRAC